MKIQINTDSDVEGTQACATGPKQTLDRKEPGDA